MKKVIFSIIAVSAIVFTSCTKEDGPTKDVKAPSTYKFERNGKSSVSFSGQTTRIKMATELRSALVDPTKTEEVLDNMFAHVEGNNDFSDAGLNASNKSIRSKTAASTDFYASNTTEANAIKADFDSWIQKQVTDVFPNWDNEASAGVAGQLQQSGGGSTRYINAKGVELNQVFVKSLIGGLMVDQMLNNYLGKAVLDAGTNVADNDSEVVAEGKSYTTMEHKWDEAYGYLYGNEANPAVPVLEADKFLNEYLAKVNGDADFAGIADEIYNAFKLGRAAIVAKNYDVRNEQAEIIRNKVSKVIAIRGVYYLQQGKNKWESDKASAFHAISEGLGFIYSLQFTRKNNAKEAYFTKAEVEGLINELIGTGNGLWEAETPANLDSVSDKIAAKFDFTVTEAGS